MRIIKLLVISIVFFFCLFTLISLLIPSRVRISKAINIGATRSTIIRNVADTTSWKFWHPAFKQARVAGPAAFLVTPLQLNDSLVTAPFTAPGKQTIVNGWQLYRYASTDSITVQWYMDFKLRWYPWQKFGSLFYEATYGAMMQQGLQELKVFAEGQSVDSLSLPPSYEPENK